MHMSQVELYQSVLLKLGRLSANELATLDAYLSRLVTKAGQIKPESIGHLAGAWENWDDSDFEDFLQFTEQNRGDMLAPRQFSL